jgi:arylsulfatase A-like enzyme
MAKTRIRLLLIQGTLLFALSSLIFISCKPSPGQESSPNVLIIFTDDMGYGDLSSFRADAVATPHIDRIGSEGVRCTDFHVPTPYCAPSRATLLTGRFPLRNGLIRNPTPDQGIDSIGISREELLLGEVFQEAGYRTALIGKWHLGHREEFFPVNHGFDEYFGILYSNDMRPVQHIENRDTVEYPIDQQFLTQRYTKRAVEFIRKQDERPFFLHLCHPMPHKPLAASPDFYTPETPDDLYADVLRELDWSTGQILQALEEEGILDKTVVLFLSDNGATYGGSNLPLKGRKHYTWEGGTRVPFLIRYPEALPGGLTVKEACWSGDVFPRFYPWPASKFQIAWSLMEGTSNRCSREVVWTREPSFPCAVRKFGPFARVTGNYSSASPGSTGRWTCRPGRTGGLLTGKRSSPPLNRPPRPSTRESSRNPWKERSFFLT